MKHPKSAIVIAAAAGMLIGGSAIALAGSGGHPKRVHQLVRGKVQPSTVVTRSGGTVTHVVVVKAVGDGTGDAGTSSTTPVDVPGMATSVTVPAGHHALLLINFTAESECYGGSTSADDYCLVEAFVDGADATPGNPGYAFNSTNQGTNSDVNWQSTSEDYSIYVGPGTHHIQMKEAVTDVGATGTQFLWIDDRQMTVQVSLAS